MRQPRNIQYILYDETTTLPVAIGTLEECAQAVGYKPRTLTELRSLYRRGKRGKPKYMLYELDKVINGDYLEEGVPREYED